MTELKKHVFPRFAMPGCDPAWLVEARLGVDGLALARSVVEADGPACDRRLATLACSIMLRTWATS